MTNPKPSNNWWKVYIGKTMKELIDNLKNEKDGLTAHRFGHDFNAWNINLCDEDILLIFKLGGLIGINLDQRVLAIPKQAPALWPVCRRVNREDLFLECISFCTKEFQVGHSQLPVQGLIT